MPKILLQTKIKGEKSIVFDLSRSIDLHRISTEKTNEKAIGGRIKGLIELDETVTWRAKHLGIYQNFTSKIIGFDKPSYFVDEMISGIFKSFKHEHYFFYQDDETILIDVLDYTSPLGILGVFADKIFLKRYLTNFLKTRNNTIKEFAETNKWKLILNN